MTDGKNKEFKEDPNPKVQCLGCKYVGRVLEFLDEVDADDKCPVCGNSQWEFK